ncbi:transferase family-domain-containing protein [Xylaria nigripes]|nr:transferase family-domain-containing protein [Xylaria nigripes]
MLPRSYQFTPLDEVIPPLFFGLIYAFPCDESQRGGALQVLQEGYDKLLQLYPYLGGEIVRKNSPDTRPGHLTLEAPENTSDTEIPVADLSEPSSGWTHSYAEVLEAGLPPSWLDAAVFAPYAAGIDTTNKPLAVQVSWIPGGCLLTVCVLHAVFDATGVARVIQTWAELCRETQGVSELNGEIARKLLAVNPKKNISIPAAGHTPAPDKSFDILKTRPELWKLLALDSKDNMIPRPSAVSTPTMIPAARPSMPGMRTVVYSFSERAAARLKADATPLNEKQWISTKDALTALIWRSVMRARFPDAAKSRNGIRKRGSDPKVRVNVPINGRALLQPKLPPSYINNVIFHCTSEMPLSQVVGSDSLATLASTIRSEINTIKSDGSLVRDAAILASLIPDVGSLISGLKDFLGSDLATTSWVDFPFYDVDFGPALGRPDLLRIPRGQWTEFCVLGPRNSKGNVEVFISLKGDEMERFLVDTEFQEYARFVCE